MSCIFFGSKFPTPKAFGVTTRETLLSLEKEGIPVKVLCPRSDYSDLDFHKIEHLIVNFPKNMFVNLLRRWGESRLGLVYGISWRFAQLIEINISSEYVRKLNPEVIWLRDPLIALIYTIKFRKIKIILEVHETRYKYIYQILKRCVDRVFCYAINNYIRDFLTSISRAYTLPVAPMGIPESHLAAHEACSNFAENIKLKNLNCLKFAYFGKYKPNGYSKGLDDLIRLANYFSQSLSDSSVTLVGLVSSEIEEISLIKSKFEIRDKNLEIISHMDHSLALNLMHNFDILILPEYESQDYKGMPIKLLEYIASGKITVVADTILYRSFFSEKFSPYFYAPRNISSLLGVVNQSLSDPNLGTQLINGVNFASNFTWRTRTRQMLTPIKN